MKNNRVIQGIKHEGISFFQAVGRTNEIAYIVLLTLYVGLFFFLKIQWIEEAETVVDTIRYGTLSIIMWGSALYLAYVIAEWKNLWKKTFILILVAAVLLVGTYFFTKKMSTNLYGVVMDAFFCILAYKKDFKKMLKGMLITLVIVLVFARIGMILGITVDVGKPETSTPGHGLGINYPNTWGFLAFLALIIIWYLYLRFKPVITFVVFWAVSAFMYSYITCRTIAGLTLIFPIAALLIDLLEKRMDRKAKEGTFKKIKPLEWIITAIPFLAWAFMMANSMAVDWWYQFYHGPLRNLAWRFLMGGLYFKKYGLPLIGNPYRSNEYTFMNVQGEFIKVGILDSSFAAYMIMRGLIWLIYTLLWLCVAHRKALKKRDYAIILIETVFLGFAMIERPGLEMWYNFILVYPLAKVFSKPRTEKFLEFDEESEATEGTKITEFEKEYKAFMEVKELPPYRTEVAEEVSIGFDEAKGVYILNLPEDTEKEGLYDIFSNVLYTERFVKGDEEKKLAASGFIRYCTAFAQLSYQMGFETISTSSPVTMDAATKSGLSLGDYVMSRYEAAKNSFGADVLSEDALLSLYDFLGIRSFCEMFANDFDRSIYDMSVFSEKLGVSIFNKIDNHMHGRPEEFLFNMSIQDYKEALSIIGQGGV